MTRYLEVARRVHRLCPHPPAAATSGDVVLIAGPELPAPSPRSRRCEDCTIYAGDELLGFVSALIARSAAGLIASAVTIPDLEAVSLMRSLHQFLLRGATLAEALHAARATIDRTDRRAFVNWCAFTAFGAA